MVESSVVAQGSTLPSAAVSPIFSAFRIGNCTLRNRVVMAPMTRQFAQDGVLAPSAVDYYRRRAAGGVGLILSEGIATSEIAAHSATIPDFLTGAARDMWRSVVEAVHQEGGLIMAQLWHTGLGRIVEQAKHPDQLSVGPVDQYLLPDNPHAQGGNNHPLGHAMTIEEIQATVEEYIVAAKHAQDIGFDGIELHAAHGYLIDQFFWDQCNRRTDQYGGDIINRTRFAVEIIRGIKQRCGEDFPVGLRFSQWKLPFLYAVKAFPDPAALAAFLFPLAEAGVDFLDASTRRYWEPAFEGSDLTLAGWAKKITGLPSMAVGSIGLAGPLDVADMLTEVRPDADLSRIAAMIERDEVDLVGVGRALLSNPDWANKVKAGDVADLAPFNQQAMMTHW